MESERFLREVCEKFKVLLRSFGKENLVKERSGSKNRRFSKSELRMRENCLFASNFSEERVRAKEIFRF
mgnify:CR=1 FL=1